jgi:Holliday junction resolvase RusA-like endonuclease
MELEFTIHGEQRPQGSKTCRVIYRNGKPVTSNGRIVTATMDANKHVKEWRRQVADAATEAMSCRPLITGPVRLAVVIERVRPAGHFRTGKNAGKLRDSAPAYPTTKPDLLKLVRAIEDGMSGIVYRDDKQIVEHSLAELYGERYRTWVRVMELPATVADIGTAR